mmetsp:Transcript_73838/g.175784  ORF Transcript_73838/g.175784 Transcript_73838/m.175784 type:complete len:80 (-) Transcript_73838:1095-1334(-)
MPPGEGGLRGEGEGIHSISQRPYAWPQMQRSTLLPLGKNLLRRMGRRLHRGKLGVEEHPEAALMAVWFRPAEELQAMWC